MSIRVTCPGCLTRFNVSDKFAGREGPCPKCKKVITIPSKSEEVVIHAPETGPTDSKGRPILKPLKREETNLSSVQITLIFASIAGFLIAALALRFAYPDPTTFPPYFLWLGAFCLAVPVSFVAYAFLRDQELEPFRGKVLWIRLGICSSVYALLWFTTLLSWYMFDGSWGPMTLIVAVAAMLAAGAAVGMLSWDFDYLTGILHYGMYMACCFLARGIAGIGVLPGAMEDNAVPETRPPLMGGIEWIWSTFPWV